MHAEETAVILMQTDTSTLGSCAQERAQTDGTNEQCPIPCWRVSQQLCAVHAQECRLGCHQASSRLLFCCDAGRLHLQQGPAGHHKADNEECPCQADVSKMRGISIPD